MTSTPDLKVQIYSMYCLNNRMVSLGFISRNGLKSPVFLSSVVKIASHFSRRCHKIGLLRQ